MSVLHVPLWAWAATVAALAVLLGADLFISARRHGPERLGEAALWTAGTITLAVAFGALVATGGGGAAAGQFFAGWLTEYSLSLDNLLVFVLLISSSGVERRYHGRVLLLGILLALLLRGLLIAVGGAALHQFAWVEYIFGAFLVYAAARVAFRRPDPAGTGGGGPLRVARRVLPVAPQGDGARLITRVQGRRYVTPLLIVVIAIGVTDVLFAVDSIPAIFGLTRDPFLVFSANLFALLGLRHLYFLIGGLLDRLVYLPAGLAAVLAFIGIKLIGEALHAYGIGHLGPVPVPQISAGVSLAVIAGILLLTTVSSLAWGRRALDRDGAGDRVGQAGRPGHGAQQGRGRWSGGARQPGRGEQADEEGWQAAGHRQVLPWAGPAPSARPDGWRLCVRGAPPGRGREGVPDVRQDVRQGHADRLAGGPPGDLHHALG